MPNIPRMRTPFGTSLLHLLTQSDKTWHVYDKNKIRDENDRCPVCSVIHQQNPLIDYEDNAWQASIQFLGRKLTGDEMRDIDKITLAADYDYTGVLCDDGKGIRNWLLNTLTFFTDSNLREVLL